MNAFFVGEYDLKGAQPLKYRIVEKEAFQVVGVKRELPCGAEGVGVPGIPAFWDEAHSNGIVNELIPLLNGEIKGLLGITDNFNAEKNTIDYWIAAEHLGEVPSGFLSFEFPASKWAVFEVVGPIPEAIIHTWRQIYSEWFPSNDYEPAGIAPIEAYIDSNLERADSYNEIWYAIK